MGRVAPTEDAMPDMDSGEGREATRTTKALDPSFTRPGFTPSFTFTDVRFVVVNDAKGDDGQLKLGGLKGRWLLARARGDGAARARPEGGGTRGVEKGS